MDHDQTFTLSNPPINEVFFGVGFISDFFRSVHFGMISEKLKDKYPLVSDKPLLTRIIKGRPISPNDIHLPRVWLEDESRNKLLQLQTDRVHYNWRRLKEGVPYPGFSQLLPEFIQEWSFLNNFAAQNRLPFSLQPTWCELTYINHIDDSSGWEGIEDISKVFNFLDIKKITPRILPQIGVFEGIYHLDSEKDSLHVSIQQGYRKEDKADKPILVFRLSVKRDILDQSDNMTEWFHNAHSVLISAFQSLTTTDAQEIWNQ